MLDDPNTAAAYGTPAHWSHPSPEAGAGGTPSLALDALAGLGAGAFAAVMLWSLPAFLGLPSDLDVALSIAVGAILAYGVTGPHSGTRRFRWGVPLAATAALLLVCAALAALPAGRSWLSRLAGMMAAQTLGWAASGGLAAPAALVAAAAAGLVVGLPVFHAARTGRPAAALLLGFVLLVVEWEFVDNATVLLFWPLILVSVFWLAADRARETARLGELDAGSPNPWTAFGMAGLAGIAVLGALLVVPRQGPPANLGGVGIWIDRLPMIGTLEKATREGSFGYAAGAASEVGPPPGNGSATGIQVHADGFDLSQTGFGASTSTLGGPVHLDNRTALVITVSGTAPRPATVYLRGAVRDVYDGTGWLPGPGEQQPDPTWPATNAGAVGRAFVSGAPLPVPFQLINARITLRSAASANLFTVLSPLRLSVPVTWDRSGEAWAEAPLPAGFSYTLTGAVLGGDVYTSTVFAPYAVSGMPHQLVSPAQALKLAQTGRSVAPAPVQGIPRNIGQLPNPVDLEIPNTVPARVRLLADRWTRGLHDPLLEALAIQQRLLGYRYTLDPKPTPPGKDFVDYFLFDQRSGYCTYYSSAMAVLLREKGIPSRWVEGYRTTVPAGGGTFAVSNAAAHAWVEAYIAPYGWMVFDPTPAAAPTPTLVGSRPTAQPAVQGSGSRLSLPHYLWIAVGLPVGFGLLLLLGALGNYLAERQTGRTPLEEAQAIWRACERVGARFGRRRRGDQTPVEYGRELATAFPVLGPAAERFAMAYGRLRYGMSATAGRSASADLERLRAGWRDLQAGWRMVSPLTYPWRRWL